MKKTTNILGLAAVLAVGGCNDGGFEPLGPPGSGLSAAGDGDAAGAALAFVAVQGKLVADCAGAACHEGGSPVDFLGAPGQDDDYSSARAFSGGVWGGWTVANARAIQKLDEGHYGLSFNGNEINNLERWFIAEAEFAATGGGLGPIAVQPGVRGFVQCLDLGDLTKERKQPGQNDDGVAFDNITEKRTESGGNQECQNCHNYGLNLEIMTTDDEAMLQMIKNKPFPWFCEDKETEPGKVVIVPCEGLYRLGRGQDQPDGIPESAHPMYDIEDDDPYIFTLLNLIEEVSAEQATGTCGGGGGEI